MKPETATPWEIVEHGHVKRVYGRYARHGAFSAQPLERKGIPIACVSLKQRKTGAGRGMSPRWLGFDADESRDLAYIVHAGNNYTQLVDALRDSISTFERVQMRCGLGVKHSMIQATLDKLRALLAKLDSKGAE